MELIIVNGSGFCIVPELEEPSTEPEEPSTGPEETSSEPSEIPSSPGNNAANDGTIDKDGSNNGLIYGCVGAAVAVVIVLAIIIIVLMKKKDQQESATDTSSVEAEEVIFRTDHNISTNTINNPLWSSANDEDIFTADFEEYDPLDFQSIDDC